MSVRCRAVRLLVTLSVAALGALAVPATATAAAVPLSIKPNPDIAGYVYLNSTGTTQASGQLTVPAAVPSCNPGVNIQFGLMGADTVNPGFFVYFVGLRAYCNGGELVYTAEDRVAGQGGLIYVSPGDKISMLYRQQSGVTTVQVMDLTTGQADTSQNNTYADVKQLVGSDDVGSHLVAFTPLTISKATVDNVALGTLSTTHYNEVRNKTKLIAAGLLDSTGTRFRETVKAVD